MGFSTPSITPAQIKAVVVEATTLLALLGLNVSDKTSTAVTVGGIAAVSLYTSVIVIADALIRTARARNATAILAGQSLSRLDKKPQASALASGEQV